MRFAWFALCAMLQAQEGESLYTRHCAVCHGIQGEGGRGPSLAKATLRNAPDDDALRRVIRGGLPNGMPGTALPDAAIRTIATHVRTLGRVPATAISGDAGQGERLYTGKGGCAKCHTLDGRGGTFGPDLTGIGSRRSAAHLRTSMTDPAADFPRDFVYLKAVTNGGSTVTGVRVNEDTFSVQLRDASGGLHSFWKTELRELRRETSASPMPAYRGTLRDAELDDLTAFLASQQEGAR